MDPHKLVQREQFTVLKGMVLKQFEDAVHRLRKTFDLLETHREDYSEDISNKIAFCSQVNSLLYKMCKVCSFLCDGLFNGADERRSPDSPIKLDAPRRRIMDKWDNPK